MFKIFLTIFLSCLYGSQVYGIGENQVYSINQTQVKIVNGDITQHKVDSIVNAANSKLLDGGGVCGAIFKAAGREQLQQACNKYPADSDNTRCPIGQARITQSFNLNKHGIQFIIHAVGPDCRIIKDTQTQVTLLKNSYIDSLRLADQNNLKSIAFPFISSGIYACPKNLAANVAVDAIIDYISNNSTNLEQIHFVLFDNEDFEIFRNTLDNKALVEKVKKEIKFVESSNKSRSNYTFKLAVLGIVGVAGLLAYKYFNKKCSKNGN